jgi:hypothetical protein
VKKPLIALCAIIIAFTFLAGSLLLNQPSALSGNVQPTVSPTQTSPQYTIQPTQQTIEQATKNAINYLRQTKDPTGLLMLNVLYRQFGIAAFNDSLKRFDEVLEANPEPINRVFRRIADCNTTIVNSDLNYVTDQLDRLTVPALYSDTLPLPDDYTARMTDALSSGIIYAQQSTKNSGCYLLTHALLATIWLDNNNCSVNLPEGFKSTLYQTNAGLIGDGLIVNDIQLEAAAFLYEAGQGGLVPKFFINNVVASQYVDGGWALSQDNPSISDWHPSILALIILLHVEYPSETYPTMISTAP